MNELLLSERAQRLLAGVRSFDKILRILTLVPVATLVIADNICGLLEQDMLFRGFAIIGVAHRRVACHSHSLWWTLYIRHQYHNLT